MSITRAGLGPQAAPLAPPRTLGELLGMLDRHKAWRLAFAYAGRVTGPGYHITEVKSARFSAVDCGGNPEAWTEIYIQLWDIPLEDGYQALTAGKARAILGVVERKVGLDHAGGITIEVSNGRDAIALYRPSGAHVDDRTLVIELDPQPSSCKPRDRWLEQVGSTRCGAAKSAGQPAPLASAQPARSTSAGCCG